MNRIKANIIGAIIGLLIFCELFKVQAASRTAMISVLIVTMHEPGQHFWDVAIGRALGVVTGCLIGVI